MNHIVKKCATTCVTYNPELGIDLLTFTYYTEGYSRRAQNRSLTEGAAYVIRGLCKTLTG